jgi:hypothetical protein
MQLDAGILPPELAQEIPYFMLGYFMGWTPDQVDVIDAERVERLIMLLQQFNNVQSNVAGSSTAMNR